MRYLLVILALLISTNITFAYNYPENVKKHIDVSQKISYDTVKKEWSRTPTKNSINFTKHMTAGSGGYSEFRYQKKYYDTNTTLEFLCGKRLMGYNQHTLKFYELDFNGEKIVSRELTPTEIHNIFPDTEIVKVSKFRKNKITLKKPHKKTRTFLLVNDTDRFFYKYNYENHGNGTELIKSLIETDEAKKIVFSHFGSRDEMFPTLTIKIKNCLFKK